MRLLVGLAEPIGRDVGVDLRGRQRRVPEQFLDTAKVGATFEQMGSGRVPEPVRRQVRRVDDADPLVDETSYRSLVDPAAASTRGRPPDRSRAAPAAVAPRPASSARASAAGTPYGTERSLRPLPKTRTTRREVSMSSMSRAQSSPTRMPVAYRSSMIARSRSPTGLPSSAATAAASSTARVSAWPSTPGRVLCGRGLASNAPGSVLIRPVRCAHAVKTRAAVARRDIVLRDLPRLCCLASQERSPRMSRPSRSS